MEGRWLMLMELFVVLAFLAGWGVLELVAKRMDRKREERRREREREDAQRRKQDGEPPPD